MELDTAQDDQLVMRLLEASVENRGGVLLIANRDISPRLQHPHRRVLNPSRVGSSPMNWRRRRIFSSGPPFSSASSQGKTRNSPPNSALLSIKPRNRLGR